MRIRIQVSTATVKAVHPRLQQAYQHDDVRVDLLSAPLTILLILSYQELPTSIPSQRSHGREVKRGAAGGQRIARMLKRLSRCSSRVRPPGCPCSWCGVVSVPLLGGSRGHPP